MVALNTEHVWQALAGHRSRRAASLPSVSGGTVPRVRSPGQARGRPQGGFHTVTRPNISTFLCTSSLSCSELWARESALSGPSLCRGPAAVPPVSACWRIRGTPDVVFRHWKVP